MWNAVTHGNTLKLLRLADGGKRSFSETLLQQTNRTICTLTWDPPYWTYSGRWSPVGTRRNRTSRQRKIKVRLHAVLWNTANHTSSLNQRKIYWKSKDEYFRALEDSKKRSEIKDMQYVQWHKHSSSKPIHFFFIFIFSLNQNLNRTCSVTGNCSQLTWLCV